MPKGIIRIPEGTVLPFELEKDLKKRFPGYAFKTYPLKPDYQRSHAKRVASLHQAFEFLLEAYPPCSAHALCTSELFKTYAAVCKKEVDQRYYGMTQDKLIKFTQLITDVIHLGWEVSVDAAKDLLNEAEQYFLMVKGRKNLVTVTPMELKQGIEYVLRVDESFPPYYEQIITELKKLQANNYPKTPAWFRSLQDQHFMQAYFCNLKSIPDNPAEDFAAFLNNWQSMKEKEIVNLNKDLEFIKNRSLPELVWFKKLPPQYREMIRVLAEDPLSLDQKLLLFKEVLEQEKYKKDLPQFIKIPQWYWVLPKHQQYFLEYALKQKENLVDAISFLSSRHRTLPMPANSAMHSLWVYRGGEFRQFYSPRVRSSHVATRDGIALNWPEAVHQRHVSSNLQVVLKQTFKDEKEHAPERARVPPKKLLLFQTLISPLCFLSGVMPDFKLEKMARAYVEDKSSDFQVIQTNHPLNDVKYVSPTASNNPDSMALITAINPYINLPDLKNLVDSMISILNSGSLKATIKDYNCRELFLSSLEQLIILTVNGYTYGSCVSGKDRKAVELMHTDSMILYKEKYDCWPMLDDTAVCRAHFVSIVAGEYLNRHQHEHAGQNAPGAKGIQNAYRYFPKDIINEINRRLQDNGVLQADDKLATNNEVKKIYVGESTPAEALSRKESIMCKLFAVKLGEKICTELYDALYLALSDQNIKRFVRKGSLTSRTLSFFMECQEIPTGISKIKNLMRDPRSGTNNIVRLGSIFEIILSRPLCNASRSEATEAIYSLRDILQFNKENVSIEEQIKQKIKNWNELFKASKITNSQMQNSYS